MFAKTLEYDWEKIIDGNTYYSKSVSNNISSVIIVDEEKKVLGIITTHDIMKSVDRIFMREK